MDDVIWGTPGVLEFLAKGLGEESDLSEMRVLLLRNILKILNTGTLNPKPRLRLLGFLVVASPHPPLAQARVWGVGFRMKALRKT